MNSLTGNEVTFKEIERSFFEIGCEVAKMLMQEFLGKVDKELSEARDKAELRHKGTRATTIKTLMGGQTISHQGVWNIVQAVGEKQAEAERRLIKANENNELKVSREVGILFEEADGLWLSMQGKSREKSSKGKKELKIGVIYEEWEKRYPSSNEYKTVEKSAFADYMKPEEFKALRDAAIAEKYNADEIVYRVLNRDGASWIKSGHDMETDIFQLYPILDACTQEYLDIEVEDQINFKSSAKAFVRTYNFLSAILPYGSVEWEMLSIFLTLLIPKLPSPRGDDLSEGILETVDLDSYRAEAQAMVSIQLDDSDAEIYSIPVGTDVGIAAPEMDHFSEILATFHDLFGNIEWTDEDKIRRQIAELSDIVSRDIAYQNAMKNSDAQNARDESDRATMEAILATMSSGIELYKHITSNESLKKWIQDMVFNTTYKSPTKRGEHMK